MSNAKIDRLDGSKPAITSPNQLNPGLAKAADFPIQTVLPANGQCGDSEAEYRRLIADKHPRLLDYPRQPGE
jgi:hypothetical protein